MKKISLFEAIATLTGTILGAGILGIPHVFARAGFWTGTIVLIIVGAVMLFMKLLFGEAVLRTNGKHQISGYAEIYLGKFFKYFVSFSLVFGIYGALLAYLIGEGKIIASISGLTPFMSSLIFLAVCSILIYAGLNTIKKTELVMSGFLFAAIVAIGFLSFNHVNLENLKGKGFDVTSLFIPYGVLLFACSGLFAVPETRQILSKESKFFKTAIILGCAIPPIVYFIFAMLVIGISGASVTEIATIGLGEMLGWKMVLMANIFGFFAMGTSFLTSGLALKQMYEFDYKLPKILSWFLVVFVPLLLFLLGARDFIKVVNVVGALGVGVNGIIGTLIYFKARKKAERKPEYIIPKTLGTIGGGLTILMFTLGIVYTFFNI